MGQERRLTIIGNIEEKPRSSCTEQNFSESPLLVMGNEVPHRSLRDSEGWGGLDHCGDTGNLIRFALSLSVKVGIGIKTGLLDITGNIESITRGFWDGETVVESDTTGDGTESAVCCVRRQFE